MDPPENNGKAGFYTITTKEGRTFNVYYSSEQNKYH